MAKKKLDKNMIKDVAGGEMLYTGLVNNGHYMIYNGNGEPICNNSFENFQDVVEYACGINDVNEVVVLEDGDLAILKQGRGADIARNRDSLLRFS